MKKSYHTFVVLAYKESPYLEECIKSVKNQSYKSNVIIATTTDNSFIRKIAKKYELEVLVGKHTNIGGDFDFAKNCAKTELVTIAHQDDVYDYNYSEKIVDIYLKNKDSLIIFTNYYEIRNNLKIYNNNNLKIKSILLSPLKITKLGKYKFFKRLSIRFGNSICCPAVTFQINNCSKQTFTSEYKSNVDWYAWEKLSKEKGKFVYINKKLMGHRIDESTTTTDIINQGIRTQEDLIILKKFWPTIIAKIINKIYSNAEKSNNTNN